MKQALEELQKATHINEQQLKGIKTLSDLVKIKIHQPSVRLESAARAILDAPIAPPPQREHFKHRFLDPLSNAQRVPWLPSNLTQLQSAIELGRSASSPMGSSILEGGKSSLYLPSIGSLKKTPRLGPQESKTLLKTGKQHRELIDQDERQMISDDPTKAIWQFHNQRQEDRSSIRDLVHRQASNLRTNYFANKYSGERSRSQLMERPSIDTMPSKLNLSHIGSMPQLSETKRERREAVMEKMAELLKRQTPPPPSRLLANVDSSVHFLKSPIQSEASPNNRSSARPLFDESQFSYLNRTGVSNPFSRNGEFEADEYYDDELGERWSDSEQLETQQEELGGGTAKLPKLVEVSRLGRIQSVKNDQNMSAGFDPRYDRSRAKSRLEARMQEVDKKRKGIVDIEFDRLLIHKFERPRSRIMELPPVLKVAPQSRKGRPEDSPTKIYKAVSQKIMQLDKQSIRTMRRASRNQMRASPPVQRASTHRLPSPKSMVLPTKALKVESSPIDLKKKPAKRTEERDTQLTQLSQPIQEYLPKVDISKAKRSSEQLQSIESIDPTLSQDSKPSRPLSKALYMPEIPSVAVQRRHQIKLKRDSDSEAQRATPSTHIDGVIGTQMKEAYQEQSPLRMKVQSVSPRQSNVQSVTKLPERKWSSTSPENSPRGTKQSVMGSTAGMSHTGFSAGRFNRYPRFTVFINNPQRQDLNTMRFSPQVMDILLAERSPNILLDTPAMPLEALDIPEERATMDQATTPPNLSKANSQLEVVHQERDKSLRMFDPFDRVAVGKTIPNAILTSVRSYTGQNNVISDSLRIVHRNFKPPTRLQANHSRLESMISELAHLPMPELEEHYTSQQSPPPDEAIDEKGSTGLRTFLNRQETKKLQLFLAGPTLLHLVAKHPMQIAALDKTSELPQITDLHFSSEEQKVPLNASIDSPEESEVELKMPPTAPIGSKRVTLTQRVVATADPGKISETPYSIEKGTDVTGTDSPLLSGRLARGMAKGRLPGGQKVDLKLLKQRIEQEKLKLQDQGSRGTRNDGVSSEQFTFRESQRQAQSTVPPAMPVRRAEVRVQGKPLPTASEEPTISQENSIHPNHTRYSSAFSRGKRRSSAFSTERAGKTGNTSSFNMEGLRATYHSQARSSSPAKRGAVLKVNIVSPQLMLEEKKKEKHPERRVLKTTIKSSKQELNSPLKDMQHLVLSTPPLEAHEEGLSQESSEISSVYRPVASPLNQSRAFARTSGGSFWRKQKSNSPSPTEQSFHPKTKMSHSQEPFVVGAPPSQHPQMDGTHYSGSLKSFHTSEYNQNVSFRAAMESETRRKSALLIEEAGARKHNMDLKIIELRNEEALISLNSQPRRTLELADPVKVARRTEEGALLEVPRLQRMGNPVVEKDLKQLLYTSEHKGKKKGELIEKHKLIFRPSRAPRREPARREEPELQLF